VASVRLSAPGTRGSQRFTPGRVDLVAQSLRNLLLTAFNIDVPRLSGPSWLLDVRVDVQATAPGSTPAQVREMLRTLLIERFGLVTHTERRPFEVYELTVGSGGITMREVEAVDELTKKFQSDATTGRQIDTTVETIDGPIRDMLITLGNRRVTARSMYERTFPDGRRVLLKATRMSMPELATTLMFSVGGERVIDRTGLTGLYQFTIELPNDPGRLPPGLITNAQGQSLEPAGLSAVKAVESLGLKLERRRVDFDVVVVDRIERTPKEN
jgi:uncharacterized protein (TIGR03435 family)